MISLLLASSLAFGQVRMPWMTEGRAVPACASAESLKFMREGRWAEALQVKERELAHIGPQLNDTDVYIAWVCLQTSKAILLTRLQRHAEAVALLDEILPGARSRLGADHPQTMSTEFLGASVYGNAGRRQEQIRMLQELRPRVATLHGERTLEMSSLLRSLSTAYAWVGNHQASLPLDREVLAIATYQARRGYCPQVTLDDCLVTLARARQHLADTMRRLGQAKQALPLAEAAYQAHAEARGRFHPNTLDARLIVASVYGELGEREKAIGIEREVLDDAVKHLGFDHEITRKARGNLAASYARERAAR